MDPTCTSSPQPAGRVGPYPVPQEESRAQLCTLPTQEPSSMKQSGPFKGAASAFICQGEESYFSLPKTPRGKTGSGWAQKTVGHMLILRGPDLGQAHHLPVDGRDGCWLRPLSSSQPRRPPTSGDSPPLL